jgi:hypothetical protein
LYQLAAVIAYAKGLTCLILKVVSVLSLSKPATNSSFDPLQKLRHSHGR